MFHNVTEETLLHENEEYVVNTLQEMQGSEVKQDR